MFRLSRVIALFGLLCIGMPRAAAQSPGDAADLEAQLQALAAAAEGTVYVEARGGKAKEAFVAEATGEEAPADDDTAAAFATSQAGLALRKRQRFSRGFSNAGAALLISGIAGLGLFEVGVISAASSSGESGFNAGFALALYGLYYGVVVTPIGGVMLAAGSLGNAGVLRKGGAWVPNGLGIATLALSLGTTGLLTAGVLAYTGALFHVGLVTAVATAVTGILQIKANERALRSMEAGEAPVRPSRASLWLVPQLDTRSAGMALVGRF